MRLVTDFQKKLAEYWIGLYGAKQTISWGGDPASSNQMISPKTFREFGMPYAKEVHEKLIALGNKHIFKHLCGDQNKNLEFWAQVPMGDPGFVSFGHEVDVEKAGRVFPERRHRREPGAGHHRHGHGRGSIRSGEKVAGKGQALPRWFHVRPRLRTAAHGPAGKHQGVNQSGQRSRLVLIGIAWSGVRPAPTVWNNNDRRGRVLWRR